MTSADTTGWPPQRCWFCDGHIFRDDPTRVVPGIGLLVHARCYEAATEPPPAPPKTIE